MSRKPRPILHLLGELKENLHYDPLTGYFYWTKDRKGGSYNLKASDRADALYPPAKYRVIYWKRVGHYAHRVAWLLQTEQEPPDEIDHEDTDKLNNEWANLREATHSQNNCNRFDSKNTSGFKGVDFMKSKKKWRARINRSHLGLFETAEEAFEAYKKAADEIHGEFARY